MRILAVDDDPVFLDLLRVSLGQIGYDDLTEAVSGAQALELIQDEATPFDCLLLDIQMPGSDGTELCRIIRAMPAYRSTPILMITANSERHVVDRAFAVGATDYISKPIDLAELRARLATVRNIWEKSQQSMFLAKRLSDIGEANALHFDFDDEVELEDVHGLISYLALENYLLKLGNMRMFANSAVGFHVRNARQIFDATSRQEFVDIMADVADAIWDSMNAGKLVFAYAGAGDFVSIFRKPAGFQRGLLKDEIRMRLDSDMQTWRTTDAPMPIVDVGIPVQHTLFPFASPAGTLEKALDSAGNAWVEPQKSRLSKVLHLTTS